MRKPVIATMSGISVAVLGLSLHASQRTSTTALGAAPGGLVEAPGTDANGAPPTGLGNADPASTAPTPSSQSPVRSPTPMTTSVPTHSTTAAPGGTRAVRSPPATTSKTAAGPAPRTTAKPPAPTVVVNGSPADTAYGPVQVQIAVRGGHIIRADAIDYPQSSGRDQEINSQAIPQLNQETVQANSAQIDTVSGATYTSGGYRQSLQSALDAAHKAGAR